MSNLILPVKIAPITPELLERFKASEELIWTADFIQVQYDNSTGVWRDDNGYTDEQPTHYLPDGLPDPSAAVEVFESEASQDFIHPESEFGEGRYGDWKTRLPDAMIQFDSKGIFTVNEGTKLGVFALPSGKVEVSK